MTLTLAQIVSYILIPVLSLVGSLGLYIMRSTLSRIEKIEHKLQVTMTQEEAKAYILDKIEPIREDIQDIKISLNKIFDLLLKNS